MTDLESCLDGPSTSVSRGAVGKVGEQSSPRATSVSRAARANRLTRHAPLGQPSAQCV